MDEKNVMDKIDEMMNEVKGRVYRSVKRLFKSGGVDTSSFDNNYALPNILLYCALLEAAEQFRPLDKKHISIVKNLKHF